MSHAPPHWRIVRSLFITSLFCGALALPALGGVLGWDIEALPEAAPATRRADDRPDEKQTAPPPSASQRLEEAIEALRSAAGRGFGFRNALLRADARVHVEWLQSSTTPKVVIGEDDWLYLADEEAMDSHRRLRPFDAATLRGFRQLLEEQTRSFEARGIPFLCVIAPDKASIESSGVPRHLRPRPGRESRLDQLVAALDGSAVELLDLRPALRDAQQREAVYLRNDTHWNDVGAWVAYREIVERLRTLVRGVPPPHPRSDFDEGRAETRSGDLARMLGLGPARSEDTPKWTRRFRNRSAALVNLRPLDEVDVDEGRIFVAASTAPGAPRALVFRDSFGSALIPLLSEHLAVAHYVWHSSFDVLTGAEQFLDTEPPQVVIAILAERRLMTVERERLGASPRP